MSNPLVQHLLSQLPSDPPPVVYHYTSADAIQRIITSRQIWATDVRHLNDAHEFAYGVRLARSSIGTYHEGCKDPGEEKLTAEMLSALDSSQDIRVCAASFSREADLLSQWRAYAPAAGGFSVGFDSAQLRTGTGKRLLPCIYGPAEQERLIGELFGQSLNLFRARIAQPNDPDQVRVLLVKQFAEAFLILGALLKDPGFEEEHEWRLVAHDSQVGKTEPEFRTGRGGFVPYLAVSAALQGHDLPICELIVGPAPHQGLAVSAARGFLEARLGRPIPIRASAIPFRAW